RPRAGGVHRQGPLAVRERGPGPRQRLEAELRARRQPMPTTHTYAELLELNSWIRKNAETWYLHCTTRTVQESKLFPTPAYMVVSYLQAYYRSPELLRKLDATMPAEDLGDRLRESNTKGNIINLSCIAEFYLAGRQMLIDLGMLRPTDALDDL